MLTNADVAPSSAQPLAGITIVSCEQAVAAPFASRQLGDLGARIIKVERPSTGDFARGYDSTVRGLSSHFVWINRNKESLALDLKHPEGKKVLRELLSQADVFIQNLAPGALDRLGFNLADLRVAHPRLITVSISGYGSDGPYRTAKAYDALVQAEAGLVSVTGTEEQPAKTGISTADIAAGMYAYSGVLAALFARERTGKGTAVEVSLFDALMEWMGYPFYFTRYGGSRPLRAGTSHAAIAPYGAFTCGDGTQFMLAIQNEREWERFAKIVLRRPELVDDPRFARAATRYTHRGTLESIITSRLTELSGTTCEQLLSEAGVAHSQQRDMTNVINHPQLVERGRLRDVSTPAGPIEMLLPPVTMSGTEPRMDAVPSLGEHTESILRGLGRTETQIAALEAEGAVERQ
ncbi:CaiB/BaiF CoA transferase family protein [Brevibacterium luteolum]|uniref:CaiB/BaiF CoA transferase family protein n=1 Tax=Brevibacterium luteolum TaxID=199591 RepID=UPI003EEDBC92